MALAKVGGLDILFQVRSIVFEDDTWHWWHWGAC